MKDFKKITKSLYTDSKPSRLERKLHHYGFRSNQWMWWYWGQGLNFGDWIGPELFIYRTGKKPVYASAYKRPVSDPVYMTVGSLLTFLTADDTAVVWGSGVLETTTCFSRPLLTNAVRGPITQKRMRDQGYKCPDVVGDPGILVPDLYPLQSNSINYNIGVIPHFKDISIAKSIFGNADNTLIIDVSRSVGEVVSDIQSCKKILSSSLHGLIVSHSYEKPALYVQFESPVPGDGCKFADYYMSGGVEDPPKPVSIDTNTSLQDLERYLDKSPIPKLDILREPLWNACPF